METEKIYIYILFAIEEYAKWWMKWISDNSEQHLIPMLETFFLTYEFLLSPLTMFGSFSLSLPLSFYFFLEFCLISASIRRNTKKYIIKAIIYNHDLEIIDVHLCLCLEYTYIEILTHSASTTWQALSFGNVCESCRDWS